MEPGSEEEKETTEASQLVQTSGHSAVRPGDPQVRAGRAGEEGGGGGGEEDQPEGEGGGEGRGVPEGPPGEDRPECWDPLPTGRLHALPHEPGGGRGAPPPSLTLLFRPKSQTARGWSLAIIEVLLAFCAPSVSGFPEAGFPFTPCHTLPVQCTWILLKWLLKCFPNT